MEDLENDHIQEIEKMTRSFETQTEGLNS